MKKTLLLAVLGSVMTFTAAADEWKIDGEFKSLNAAKTFPARWIANKPLFKGATATLVNGKDASEKAVQIDCKTGSPAVYSATLVPVKAGDKVEIEFEAKGQGVATMCCYLYDAKNVYITTVGNRIKIDSPAKFTKYKTVFIVRDGAKSATSNARVAFGVAGKGTIAFADIEAEIVK